MSDHDKFVSFFPLYPAQAGFFLFSNLNKTVINSSYDQVIHPLPESENQMNTNLTKYLSEVFRNEIQDKDTSERQDQNPKISQNLVDSNTHQFLLDKRFSLRLDEII